MADEFDDLKAAMEAATPPSDPLKRRENIALAEENFARLQGSRAEPRQIVQKGRCDPWLEDDPIAAKGIALPFRSRGQVERV